MTPITYSLKQGVNKDLKDQNGIKQTFSHVMLLSLLKLPVIHGISFAHENKEQIVYARNTSE